GGGCQRLGKDRDRRCWSDKLPELHWCRDVHFRHLEQPNSAKHDIEFQGAFPQAMPVYVSVTGQLGIQPSSARFKQEIEDMGEASTRLLDLRPVTFRYWTSAAGPPRYGAIAEEVREVYPELVAKDGNGDAITVHYEELPAMLLNELQKQVRVNARQAEEITTLAGQLAELASRLGRLDAAEQARATMA